MSLVEYLAWGILRQENIKAAIWGEKTLAFRQDAGLTPGWAATLDRSRTRIAIFSYRCKPQFADW